MSLRSCRKKSSYKKCRQAPPLTLCPFTITNTALSITTTTTTIFIISTTTITITLTTTLYPTIRHTTITTITTTNTTTRSPLLDRTLGISRIPLQDTLGLHLPHPLHTT